MDPLSALGVAAAAVGFFDCAVGLVKIYQAVDAHGPPNLLYSIEKCAEDLVSARGSFLHRPSRTTSGQSRAITENEEIPQLQAVDELLRECDATANRLLAVFDTLKGDNKTKWDTLKHVLKTKWKDNELKEIHDQLTTFRGQLALRVLMVLNAKLDYSSQQQAGRFTRLDRRADEIVHVLAVHHQGLVNRLEQHASQVASANRGVIEAILTLRDGTTTSVMLDSGSGDTANKNLGDSFPSKHAISIQKPQDGDEGSLELGKLDEITSRVLTCLHFRQMRDRVESIPEAHRQTCQWIFDEPRSGVRWDSFPAWLQGSEPCYWINGKAGSGKSTLMKFIWSHPGKSAYLGTWSKNRPLIMASFFFWYLGTPLQKTQAGLLRSLLHDILVQQPNLIPAVMPDLCREATKDSAAGANLGDPSITELTRWFKNLACNLQQHQRYRFCLFIDGLDEFVGDHPDLADFLVGIASKSKHMKLVVSSRPLTAFTEAFRDVSSLRLQDITEGDIRDYANEMLSKKLSPKLGSEWDSFLEEIVTKSSGVFLWVSLVVKSLLAGLRDGNTVSELRERLNELPSDLKDLYQHMLDRIPANYRLQASEIFQITLTNVGDWDRNDLMPQLTLLELAFALDKSTFPFGKPPQALSRKQQKQMASETEVRLRARCLGLFEVHRMGHRKDLHDAPIDFIHRTAVEFLSTDNVVKTLGSPVGFSPLASLFRACLWMGRTIPIPQNPTFEQDQETWRYLKQALQIASRAEMAGIPISFEYIREMDRLYTTRWETAGTYWVDEEESRPTPKPSCWGSFLFKADLERYTISYGRPLLAMESLLGPSEDLLAVMINSAPLGSTHRRRYISPAMLLAAMRHSLLSFFRDALASYYSDPTQERSGPSVPTLCLEYLIDGLRHGAFQTIADTKFGHKAITQMCQTLFLAGADPNAQLEDPNTNMSKGTPWTLVAGYILGQYGGAIDPHDVDCEGEPWYGLWEVLLREFVDFGAKVDTAVDARPFTDVEPGPFCTELRKFRYRHSNSTSTWQTRIVEHTRQLESILKSPPDRTKLRRQDSDALWRSTTQPGQDQSGYDRVGAAHSASHAHVPPAPGIVSNTTFDFKYDDPVSPSTRFHDLLRLIFCCKAIQRG